MDPNIESLLNLQKYDIDRLQAEIQLAHIPREVASLEEKIEGVRAEEKRVADELKELELRRKQVDMELKAVEDQIAKYKTQQLSVKKNEEYQALIQQIGQEEVRIGAIEDKGLEVLELVDQKKVELDARKLESKERIESLEGQIKHLAKQKSELEARMQGLVEAVERAAQGVSKLYLSKYQQVSQQVKRPPYVVAIEEGRCKGCHLKVSGDIIGLVRKGEGVVQCDSCSRIVYWEG